MSILMCVKNDASGLKDRLAINRFDRLCRDSSNHCVRRHVFRDYCSRRNDRAFSDPYSIRDNCTGTKPDIIFDDNAFCRDSLLHEGTRWVVEHVIDGNDLCERRGIYAVPDLHAALPPDHRIFANQTIAANLYSGVRYVPKIVDMQNRSVHHDRSGSNVNAARAGMEVNSLVQIHTVTKPNVVRKPQTDATFDRSRAIHVQDEAIEQTSQSHADDRGNPSKQSVYELFE